MRKLAIIGGTGLSKMDKLTVVCKHNVATPFGATSAEIIEAKLGNETVFFLPRHGESHTIAPHKINYRANLWALHSLGITSVIAVAAVGGISANAEPETLDCPDQVIDYTYGREQSFFSDDFLAEHHIDFTHPYSESLRQQVLGAARQIGLSMIDNGVYGATQGPRLETAAEIKRMARDGCTLVGMTGMPEAALARELGLDYACCALVVNWAAGLSKQDSILSEIEQAIASGMVSVEKLLTQLIEQKGSN
jgi:5'-deoxy-5'-methylthioadenosine phosphorylase